MRILNSAGLGAVAAAALLVAISASGALAQQSIHPTGGQPTLSRDVDLAAVAAGAGYAWARRCFSSEHATEAMAAWLAAPGPAFLDIEVDASDADPAPRVPMTPEEMAERLRAALAT